MPGTTSAFFRILFAALVVLPWYLWKRPLLPSRNATFLTLTGGVLLAVDLVLWQVAVLMTSAANATLLANLAPVWVGLSAYLLRERLGLYFWPGLMLALAGVFLVVIDGSRQMASFNDGDLLALAASLFYGLYFIVTQRVRTNMNTVTFLALSATSGVVLSLAMCLVLGAPLGGFSSQAWLSLAALGLVSHFGGYLAINYALGHMSAATVSVSLLMQTVITALLSISLLGEFLSVQQIIGGSLVLAGIYVVNRFSTPNEI